MRLVPPLAASLLLAGCVSSKLDADGTILTPAEANRAGLAGAATAPLRDINLVQTKIPATLLLAYAEPYARPADAGCSGLISEVEALNEALGPDLDSQEVREKKKMGERAREIAGTAAIGAVADTAQDIIPFRGWMRKLTGAEKHERLVNETIAAGEVRRAYLKGLGEARGCNPPGTPMHLAETPEPPTQGVRPAYPIE